MQILLQLVGWCDNFDNFDSDNREMVAGLDSGMFNPDSERTMVTAKIGRHTVEYYDEIGELPIVRFHKYQKLLLVDSGVGANIAAFDQRLERARHFLLAGKSDKAQQELENLRQCVWLIQSGISPRHRAFAALVTKIDGRDCLDVSDEALEKVTALLNDVPVDKLTALLDAVKKKIDNELTLYFPKLFNDSSVKEYYDLLKARTMAILKNIIEGVAEPGAGRDIERLTTELITYSNPKVFSGSESAEIQFDRQFENLCLVLSEQLHIQPKGFTVLEFYNAFDFLQERTKQAEQAQKRGKSGR